MYVESNYKPHFSIKKEKNLDNNNTQNVMSNKRSAAAC